MACQALVRCLFALVAADAEPHLEIDVPLGDGLLTDVAVAGGAVDLGPDVWRVVEPDVRFRSVSVHTLPGDVDAPFLVVGHGLDERAVGGNRFVANHARLHTGKPGNRAFHPALMAVLGAHDLVGDVRLVRGRDGLPGGRPDVQEVVHGAAP